MDKTVWAILGSTLLILVGVVVFGGKSQTAQDELAASFSVLDNEVIEQGGIHWHPELAIYIHGEKQHIPTSIGIGEPYSSSRWYKPAMGMADIHTHEGGGVLHWEMAEGPIRKGHVKLGAFFEIWGKPFSKTQIFDATNGEQGTVSMLVNGQPNTEFENYLVRDKDKIEIRYE